MITVLKLNVALYVFFRFSVSCRDNDVSKHIENMNQTRSDSER